MTKLRDEDATKERLEALVARLVKRLDLGWLTWVNRFETSKDGDRVACSTVADWEYRQVSMKWMLAMVASMTDEELEALCIHEMVHGLIAPLWVEIPTKYEQRLNKVMEFSTENVARAILAALQK